MTADPNISQLPRNYKPDPEDDPEFRAFEWSLIQSAFALQEAPYRHLQWLDKQRRKYSKRTLTDPDTALTWEELKTLPTPIWLMPQIWPQGLGRIWGDPSAGKTFLLLDMTLTLAVQGIKTVYIAAEGAHSIKSRVTAWLKFHNIPEADIRGTFRVRVGPVDMTDAKSVEKFISRQRRFAPDIVVVDTLSRCFGANNENEAKDMNTFVASCYRLQEELHLSSVMVVHHPGKDARRGGRGSTVLIGALDFDWEFKPNRTLACRKMKDAPDFAPRYFKLEPAFGSAVMVPSSEPVASKTETKKTRKTGPDQDAMNLGIKAVPKEGGIQETQWQQDFIKRYVEMKRKAGLTVKPDSARKQFTDRIRPKLIETKLVRIEDGAVFRT